MFLVYNYFLLNFHSFILKFIIIHFPLLHCILPIIIFEYRLPTTFTLIVTTLAVPVSHKALKRLMLKKNLLLYYFTSLGLFHC